MNLRMRSAGPASSASHCSSICRVRARRALITASRMQPPRWRKTATADRTRPPDQATQDRTGPPASQDYVLLLSRNGRPGTSDSQSSAARTSARSPVLDALARLCRAAQLEAAGVRRLHSSGQRPEQGGRVVASPVHHAVDEQRGGAPYLSRGDPAVDVPADTL